MIDSSNETKPLRVAFVVQRYGLEVNGGSETLCRMIAGRIARHHEVEVLTTRAIDYATWENSYPEGICDVNGIRVHRFGVDYPRDQQRFDDVGSRVFGGPHPIEDEINWMKKQGPYSSELLHYLADTGRKYDVFVFFTYLYATTYFGLPLVKDKAVLVSTCHDEPPVYLQIFDRLFQQVRYLIYLTPEEKAFVQRRFFQHNLKGDVVGTGVDPVLQLPQDCEWDKLRDRLGGSPYILYVGRIDEAKGCRHLIEYFTKYVQEKNRPELKLVLIGKAVMRVPEHPQVLTTGFVSEATKLHLIQHCSFMAAPSPYESLCISVLESWMLARPVLSNGQCKILRGQCKRSNGGLWYGNYEEFRETATLLLTDHTLATALGRQGHEFVQSTCTWQRVDERYLQILSYIANSSEGQQSSNSVLSFASER
jgi:glycosyltransferase involved in cell wall biosynthesis